jgi:hypothetical protein
MGHGSLQRKLVVNLGNTATHNAKVTRDFFQYGPLKRLPEPPHSLDISASDFYLFGKVKNALIGQAIPDQIGLLEILTDILDGISSDELQAAFRSCMKRVQDVIDATRRAGDSSDSMLAAVGGCPQQLHSGRHCFVPGPLHAANTVTIH